MQKLTEAQRRDRQRNSPSPSRHPSFLNTTATTAPTTSTAVGPQSAGARNVLLDDRPPAGKRYLTAAQLRERYGGVSHMWVQRRLQNDATFPRPVKLGGSLIRLWDLDGIEAWERACVVSSQRREAAGAR